MEEFWTSGVALREEISNRLPGTVVSRSTRVVRGAERAVVITDRPFDDRRRVTAGWATELR
jgi:hypothetical protein